jgi:hypothetical protein
MAAARRHEKPCCVTVCKEGVAVKMKRRRRLDVLFQHAEHFRPHPRAPINGIDTKQRQAVNLMAAERKARWRDVIL